MSVIKVTAGQWEAILNNNTDNLGDTYIIVDTAKNIESLPADQIGGNLVEIESNDASLVLDAAQAEAVLNITQDGETTPPYVRLSAPSGDQVILADSFANITSLSSFYIAQLESAGLSAVDITATATDIAALTESQISAAVALLATSTLGQITFTATDTSVVLSTTEAIDFENAANPGTFQIVAPTNQTVAVAGSAASLGALSTNQIAALHSLGVQSLAVNDDVRPEFSIGQLAALAEASLALNEPPGIPLSVSGLINDEANPAGLTPGDAYVLQAGPSDFTSNILSADVIADAPQQVVSIRVDDPVTLSLAQAEALENASLIITVPEGFTVTVVDNASALEGLSDNRLAALGAVGVTAIAADDRPAVFSAGQMQALQQAGIPVVAPPDNASQNDGSYDLFNPNGLTIDVTWDPSVASAPADFEATVEAGIKILEHTITNKITVNLDVGYGEVGDQLLAPNTSAADDSAGYTMPYSTLRLVLAEDETSDVGIAAVNSLPDTQLLDGQSNITIGNAEAKALGLLNNDGSATAEATALGLSSASNRLVDGYAGFGVGFTDTVLVDATLHELTHAMGRIDGASGLSLFRYTSPGSNDFTTSNAPSYFSIDGGVTKLADFGEATDDSDFRNSPASSLTPNDPFDEIVEGDGDLTPQDLVMLNVLGFQINSVESYTASDIEAFSSTDLGLLASVDAFEIKPLDSLVTLNVAQIEAWENISLVSILASPGDTVALVDTAADIAGLSVLQLNGLAQIGVNQITVTDGANLVNLYTEELEDLYVVADDEGGFALPPLALTAPGGGGLTLVDSVADLEVLSAVWLDELALINVTKIVITDWAALEVADAESLETTYAAAAAMGLPPIPLSAPGGGGVTVTDTADAIAGMSAKQLDALASIGVAAINPIGGTLNVADAEILETTYAAAAALGTPPIPLTTPGGGSVTVVDTNSAIEGMSAEQISALPSIGVGAIAPSTVATLVLNIAQGVAIEDASLVLEPLPFIQGGALQFADTAANIEAFSTNAAQFLALSNLALADGATELVAKNGPVVLSLAGALAFVGAPFRLVLPQGVQLDVLDTPSAVSSLTTTEIGELAALGVSVIATHGGIFELDVAQINALESAGITISTAPLFVINIITDTAAHIAALTSQEIEGLAGLSQDPFQFTSTTGPITFDVSQLQAIVSVQGTGITPGTSYSVADTAANIETLTPDQITASADDLGTFPELITVTAGTAVVLDLAQALAAVGPFYLSNGASVHFSYDALQLPGLEFKVADTAADFEALTPSQIDALGHLNETDVNFTVAATDASLVFSAAQAETAAADGLSISVPAGDTVSIGDTAVDIRDFLDHGAAQVSQVEQVLNISGIAATDGAVALTASQAEALEAANAASGLTVAVTAPSGQSVTLADSAADIALMSPTQLSELPSIGVTAITVTDQSIMLSVDQALALFDLVPISVSAGDQIIVSDTESAIDNLTVATRAELTSIGAQVVEIGPLTIAGGQTLAIDGPVPNYQTITFAGAGGTLSLDDTSGMAGTIYGFSPLDMIGLTDVPFDSNGTAGLATDPNDNEPAIQVVENGNTYYLDIDPSQIFLTTPTFKLSPDAGGTGSDLTVVEPPVTGSVQIPAGATVDGVVIGSGGEVEAQNGATVNRAVVEPGGELIADVGSTITDPTINTGGLLDLTRAAAGSGAIGFGPPVGDPVGGTLEIDNAGTLSATIVNFADGDTIDLTAIAYDPNGSADLVAAANMLDVTENGSTYTLQFDQSQDFTGEYFHLAPDSTSTHPGTDITENTTPCYCAGTLIRTNQGEQRVERLKIGDKIKTMSGAARPIKWIGRRSYSGRFSSGRKDILPICIKAGAIDDNVPRRDLWISPHHAMYLEGVLIEAKDIVNGVSIVRAERVAKVEYFHVELETHDVIIAEGALSESFIDDDSRNVFHNAHEFRTIYPDAATSSARYCAPRPDDGYMVEAVRQRIAERAGLLRSADPLRVGVLRGHVDHIGPRCVLGWAQNVDHPEAPVCLDIYAGGRLIGQTLANKYREDLKLAGLGSGRHSFAFKPASGLVLAPDSVRVRRSLDGSVVAKGETLRRA